MVAGRSERHEAKEIYFDCRVHVGLFPQPLFGVWTGNLGYEWRELVGRGLNEQCDVNSSCAVWRKLELERGEGKRRIRKPKGWCLARRICTRADRHQ